MRLHNVHPSDEELRVLLEAGFILREAGRFDDAEAIFRGLSELQPDSEVPQVGLGTVELQRGRTVSAEAIFDQALLTQPESLYARVHRAEALLFLHRRAEAVAELKEVAKLAPDSPHARTAHALLEAAHLICGPDQTAGDASGNER